MQNKTIVMLGTGGTIAGLAGNTASHIDYNAAQVGVSQLVGALPGLGDVVCEQVAQIDSKDMSFDVWTRLANRAQHHLSQDGVQGLVITHGTDTLEETAYFLHAVLNPVKPVVLTCAMRPASALAPDGPQNIIDSVAVARCATSSGVVVVCAGNIHSALDVQKTHTYRLDAFGSGDSGVLGLIEENNVKFIRNRPISRVIIRTNATENIAKLNASQPWPRVEIIMNYAGVDGAVVDALLSVGVQGLVVAGTGNGTVHRSLESALLKAQTKGVEVVRATRCPQGRVLPRLDDRFPSLGELSPVKTRIALMLKLMGIAA